MSRLFASGGQSIRASSTVLPMSIQGWLSLGFGGLISLLSKGISRVFSNTAIQKHHFFSAQPSLWSNSHIRTWLLEKSWLWLYRPLSAKWCLCFWICYRFVIAFLPRSKCLLISWLQSPSTVTSELKKIKSCHWCQFFPFYLHEVMGLDAMILVFECWVSSNSCFTFIKRLFCSSLLSVKRVVSSAYLRLLIFLLAILIPACASSSLAFHMMYSACQGICSNKLRLMSFLEILKLGDFKLTAFMVGQDSSTVDNEFIFFCCWDLTQTTLLCTSIRFFLVYLGSFNGCQYWGLITLS